MNVTLILPALTEAASPLFRPIRWTALTSSSKEWTWRRDKVTFSLDHQAGDDGFSSAWVIRFEKLVADLTSWLTSLSK